MSSLPLPPPSYSDTIDAPTYDDVTGAPTTQISCSNCGFVQEVEQEEESGASNEGFQSDGRTATTSMIVVETIEEGFKNVSSIDDNQPPIYSNIVKTKSCTNCGYKFGTPMNTPATRRNRSASEQLNNVIERIERKATVLSTNRTRYESFGEQESSPVLPWWKRIPTKLYVNLVYFCLFIVAMIITVQIIKAHRID